MERTERTKRTNETTMSVVVSNIHERDANILVLHYRNKMSARSLSEIFDIDETEVAGIITTFAEQFSNIDNLNNVIDCLIKMRKDTDKKGVSRTTDLSSKDKEIAELRRLLKESEIKAETYLEMIKVAEQTFKIPIRKKCGAK